MHVRYGTYHAGSSSTLAPEMWEYADGHDDGHGTGNEYPYLRHVSVDVESDSGICYCSSNGRAYTYALRTGYSGASAARQSDGKGDEYACADRQQQVYVRLWRDYSHQ